MAENENLDDDDLDLATEGGDKKGVLAALKNKKMLMLIGGGILLIALSIGGTLLLVGGGSNDANMEEEDTAEEVSDKKQSDAKKAKKKGKGEKEPVYFALEPSFVVNFTDKTGIRYLQASMDLLVTDALVIDDLKKHMPLIRNNMLLLLGSQ
ncbi:MAG: flagellar basal body-associated FliL family protein, partial [Gammaproteobacteria bacterium]|nr:flagellar basal body-associated FliL family protein [Gammaproteobacteria bacterium]